MRRLAWVLVCTSVVAAQEGARLERVVDVTGREVRAGAPGQVVVVEGAGFPAVAEGDEARGFGRVSARLGRVPLQVLGVEAERLTLLLPAFGLETGRAELRVEVEGRALPPLPFEVVEEDTTAGVDDGGGEVASVALRVDRFVCVEEAGSARFEVEGSAPQFPDGFSVQVHLKFGASEVSARKAEFEGGRFAVVFGPYPQETLLRGSYVVDVLFELGKQSRVGTRRFERGLSQAELDAHERVVRREIAVVGSQVEIAEQQRQIQEHYIEVANQAERLLGELQTAFGCACRTFFRPPGSSSYDEQEYRGYIERMGFATTPSALDDMSSDTTYARRTGQIKPDEYGRFLEEVLFGEVPHNGQETLVTLYRKHLEFVERFMTSPDERSDLHVDYLVSIVVQLGRDWSRRLYTHEGLEVPGVVEGTRIRPEVAPEITQRFFRARRRMLLRQIGRSDLVEGDGEDG